MSSQGTGVGALSRAARLRQRYESVTVPVIEHEDRMTVESASEIWEDIFGLFRAQGEEARDAVKVAVYAYFAVNGTSRVGKFSRDVTAGSEVVSANEITRKIVGGTFREFFRADVTDAYYALKSTGVLEEDEVFVEKAVDKGVPRGFVHCAVDYLRGCPEFTVQEKKYADAAFKLSITRASAARGGRDLDGMETSEREERVLAGTREVSGVEDF